MPEHQSLTELEGTDEFIARHIGPMPAEQDVMLEAIGAASLDALISETVPASILLDAPLDLPGAVTERAALARLREVAAENVVMTSLIGQGYSDTITPAVIQRNVLENPAWYTSYTPYQPEISQGRLEALLNYQTLVADLTGLPLANASLLDEATAAAEAMTMARRATKSDSAVFFKFSRPLRGTWPALTWWWVRLIPTCRPRCSAPCSPCPDHRVCCAT